MSTRAAQNRKKCLNGNILKLIAVIAMTVDHIGWKWVETTSPEGQIIHFFGRITIPVMCFFVAEGFFFTKDLKKYILRLFVFTAVSHFPFCLYNGISLTTLGTSVMLPLTLGLCALTVFKNQDTDFLGKIILIFVFCLLSYTSDWSFFPVLWILSFGIFRENLKHKIIFFCLISFSACAFYINKNPENMFMTGLFLSVPLLLLYNGKRGRKNFFTKWGFYAYYPLHLAILFIIDYYII